MTAYTTYTDGKSIAAPSGANAAGYPAQTVLVGTLDTSKRSMAAGDTALVLDIPEGTFVHKVFYEVLAADATQTLDIGDGVDPNGYVEVADVGTAGNHGVGAGAFATGKYYSAAGTILAVVPSGKAFDTLKVRISVACTIVGVSG